MRKTRKPRRAGAPRAAELTVTGKPPKIMRLNILYKVKDLLGRNDHTHFFFDNVLGRRQLGLDIFLIHCWTICKCFI